MAGTLEVTEELCWMPAGWVFDTVLERMAAEIHPQEPALAARLLAARAWHQHSLRDCSRSCNSSAACCRLGRRPVWRSGSGNSHANRVVHSMSCLPHDSVLPFAQF